MTAYETGTDRIMIYGPKNDGTYLVEFRTAEGDSLAISVPGSEARVLKHFQARIPYGLVVPAYGQKIETVEKTVSCPFLA